jgi:serine/threonine-protein kinase
VVRPKGRLSVNVLPWARVTLDGRALGGVPITKLEVPAGSHELVLSNDTGDRVAKTITIEAGKLLEVTSW